MSSSEKDASTEKLQIDSSRMDNMEADIRQIKQIQQFIVSALPERKDRIKEVFKEKAGASELFLALYKHPQTQKELMESLKMSQGNVSKISTHLDDAGLIVPIKQADGSNKYYWSDLAQRLKAAEIAKQFIKK